ncbi:MAG: S8 family serine peptidase [Cyanobacteria bacterium P01_G01_bin.39]
MFNDLSEMPVQTTGRYLVVLPEEDISSGMSALRDSTGARDINDSVVSNLGIAVVDLDPNQLSSLNAAVAGTQPILSVEPEQIMYAIENTTDYLQGYKDGVTNLVDSLNGTGATPQRQFTTAATFDGTNTWGLQATKVINSQYSGTGIKIAVLDTGLDLNHPDFANRTITERSFISGETVQDRNGHGTHCIGTSCGPLHPPDPSSPMRYGVAYNAEIFAGKVLSDQGSGPDGSILAGINWAINSNCQIISMSLGSATSPGTSFPRAYERAAKRALANETLIIAAAGNDSLVRNSSGRVVRPLRRLVPPKPVGRPANCPSIMAVAALNNQLQIAPFSNGTINPDGGGIDLAGPGVDIYSTYSQDTVPQRDLFGRVIDPNPPSRYKTISGTSMATPHVAGIAALYAEATGKRGLELWALLMRDPLRLALPSTDVGIGLAQATM